MRGRGSHGDYAPCRGWGWGNKSSLRTFTRTGLRIFLPHRDRDREPCFDRELPVCHLCAGERDVFPMIMLHSLGESKLVFGWWDVWGWDGAIPNQRSFSSRT